jgi:hypothetical protein
MKLIKVKRDKNKIKTEIVIVELSLLKRPKIPLKLIELKKNTK